MEIIISGRHFDITDELKAHTETQVARLAEEYSKLTIARVVLEMERSWQLAEIHLTGKNMDIEAKAKTRDMYQAVDEAVEKAEKQLRKQLEKIQQHREEQIMAENLKFEMPQLQPEEVEVVE
jgi:putative sigma-54 modulation protein